MFEIRPLTKADIDPVAELEKRCFPQDPWSRQAFLQELASPLSLFLTARDEGGNLAGYGGVWFLYDIGNITNLAVGPDYRRQGLGRELLQSLVRACTERGMESVTLEVRAGNTPAIGLYIQAGFQPCGLRKRYYRDREDAVIMTRQIVRGDGEPCGF